MREETEKKTSTTTVQLADIQTMARVFAWDRSKLPMTCFNAGKKALQGKSHNSTSPQNMGKEIDS